MPFAPAVMVPELLRELLLPSMMKMAAPLSAPEFNAFAPPVTEPVSLTSIGIAPMSALALWAKTPKATGPSATTA